MRIKLVEQKTGQKLKRYRNLIHLELALLALIINITDKFMNKLITNSYSNDPSKQRVYWSKVSKQISANEARIKLNSLKRV